MDQPASEKDLISTAAIRLLDAVAFFFLLCSANGVTGGEDNIFCTNSCLFDGAGRLALGNSVHTLAKEALFEDATPDKLTLDDGTNPGELAALCILPQIIDS